MSTTFATRELLDEREETDARIEQIQACMYQYSRAIYRSLRELIDPYVSDEVRLEYRRAVLWAARAERAEAAQHPRQAPHHLAHAPPGRRREIVRRAAVRDRRERGAVPLVHGRQDGEVLLPKQESR